MSLNTEKKRRKSWDEYFMDICEAVSERGTCDRGKNGCIIVKDKQILSTGYVGSPVGLPHCDDVGHLFKKHIDEDGKESMHCVRTTHAEANAITKVAKSHNSSEGATLYVTDSPCVECSKLIIQSGIKRVVFDRKYRITDGLDLLERAGVELEELHL